jgi:rare lipoprotein A
MGDSAVGTLTRAVAALVVLGLAGCSAPGTRYSAGYSHHHRGYETARSSASAREHVADLGGGSRGLASYYSGRAATGERVGSNALTAAHRTLPFGTKVRVTNLKNGQSVTVRINDRGPFVRNRSIDLSDGAAGAIGMKGTGIAPVRMEVIR